MNPGNGDSDQQAAQPNGRTRNGSMNSNNSNGSSKRKVVTYERTANSNSDDQTSKSSRKEYTTNYHDQSPSPNFSEIEEDVERNGSLSRHLSSSSEHLLAKIAPRDKYKLVCFGFTILGITTLLPWNFFITATDYWMYKFRNVTGEYNVHEPHKNERTSLQTFFESYLAIAANVPMLLSMFVNSIYGQRFSQKARLYASLTVMLIVFAMTTVFVKIETDHIQTAFFAITMVMVVIISFFSAIFQAAIFGIVANFPNNCMHAMVNGQAAAGLLAVAIQILSMINNSGPIKSGLWYFLASTIFLAFAIVCYWFMDNDYSRYYLLKIPDEDQLSTSISVNIIESKWEILEALEDCWQMAASVILAFWASLSVFPGVCVLVVPEHPNMSIFTGRFFVPITTFLLFNFGDLVGRVCSSYLSFPAHKKNLLLWLTVARGFIPLLVIFCNIVPKSNLPNIYGSDLVFPILVGLTALTNGYVFSSAMVMASHCSDKNRLELTGFVMASALGIGLTLGSLSSTILISII